MEIDQSFIPTGATIGMGRGGVRLQDFNVSPDGVVMPTSAISLPVARTEIGGRVAVVRSDGVAVMLTCR
jgi:hypothetical protein